MTAPTAAKQTEAWGAGVKIDYVEATDTYTVTAASGESASFTPLDRTIFFSYPVAQWAKGSGTVTDTLTLTVPNSPGMLRYTASGSWIHNDSGPAGNQIHYFVTGSQTVPTDLPLSGTASYYFRTGGSIVDNGTNYSVNTPESSASLSANFATGGIATSLHLVGRLTTGAGSSVDFGTYTGTGTLTSGSAGFTGTLTGSGRNGVFSGSFFGPQAVEVGYGWGLQGTGFDAQGAGVGLAVAAAAQAYPTLEEVSGDFHLQSAAISFKGTVAAPTNPESKPFGSGLKIDYSEEAGTLVLSSTGAGVIFASTDQVDDAALPANVTQWTKTVGSVTDTLTGTIPSVNGVALSYTMLGRWQHVDADAPANNFFQLAVTGIPTGFDMPLSGTATYTAATGGMAQDGGVSYNIVGTAPNVTLSANFGTGAISTTLTLVGQPTGGGSNTALGTFTGAGTLTSGTSAFAGTLTGGSSRSGLFSGGFFGPAAAEFGYAWQVQGTGFNAQGVAAGKKD